MTLLSTKQLDEVKALELVNEDGTLNDSAFIDKFQSEDIDSDCTTLVRLGALLEAVKNSEALLKQFDTDHKKVKEIAISLFIKGEPLYQLPSVIDYNGKLFIESGRHRIEAIYSTLTDAFGETGTVDLKQLLVGVSMKSRSNLDYLAKSIQTANDSRRMRGVEDKHITGQAKLNLVPYDAKATAFNKVLANESISKSERNGYMGLLFFYLVKKNPTKLNVHSVTPENLNKLGAKLSALAFGIPEFPKTAKAFTTLFTSFATALTDIIPNLEQPNIGRAIGDIVEEYYEGYLLEDLEKGVYVSEAKSKKSSKAAELIASEEE